MNQLTSLNPWWCAPGIVSHFSFAPTPWMTSRLCPEFAALNLPHVVPAGCCFLAVEHWIVIHDWLVVLTILRNKLYSQWGGLSHILWKIITLLRVIPTMTFIHFLTGKSSGILSDISSDILFGILSGISSGILSGISHGILSGISSGILSGMSSDILSDIFSDILPVEVRQCPLRSGSRG